MTANNHTTPPPHLRRNFALGVLNGALFIFMETLTDPALVIAWFLDKMGASNFLIGLIVPLRDAGWSLPQLFTSRQLSSQPYKMPTYRDMAIVRILAWSAITAVIFFVRAPSALIIGFLIPYIVYSLASGVAGLPFMDIVAKTIPPRQRGSYFGERLFWGGVLSIGGGALVKLALDGNLGLDFPHNVGALMLIATLVSAIALETFILVIEPPDPAPVELASWRDHLNLAFQVPNRDPNFRLYLGARVVLIFAATAIPFLTLYATGPLQADAGMIGVYLIVRMAASLLSNRLWGPLSDRRGGRLVMLLSAGLGLGGMIIALLIAPLAQLLALPSSAGPWLFTLVFVLIGSSNSGIGVSGSSLMLNLAPDERRGLYVGFANTALGAIMLLTGLSGLIVDLIGYLGMFILATLCYALGLAATARLRESHFETK